MIIQLLDKIPIKIYLYILIFAIVIFGIIGTYMYLKMELSSFQKSIVIWYFIILEINMIHLYFILSFYSKNKNKKGEKGGKGETGARGFKGENQICSQCGDSGIKLDKYAGISNDNGKRIDDNPNVVRGKCVFPFISNHKYHYDCTTDPTPTELKSNPTLESSQEAGIFGWCATSVDGDMNVESYGFCNENNSITAKRKALLAKQEARRKYLKENQGILDIILVDGNTTQEAKNKCLKKGAYGEWEIIDQDLNEGTGGKFIYMCVNKGTGNRGVTDILIHNQEDTTKLQYKNKKDGSDIKIKGYDIVKNEKNIKVDLNKDAKGVEGKAKTLYMFKKRGMSGFIKEIDFKKYLDSDKNTKANKKCPSGYKIPKIYYDSKNNFPMTGPVDLNYNTIGEDSEKSWRINMCLSTKSGSETPIDTALVYKDNNLYFFRKDEFYKMKKTVVQNSISIDDAYPKNIGEKWFKQKDKEGRWDAAFTYGYDKKTYFFKGDLVYKYDDKNMKLAPGFPQKISRVFKGVPDNINAVFTWGKDHVTYFFKGAYYYKYNDKQKKVERGYPKLASHRWKGMPLLINAIFSFPLNIIGAKRNTNTTYVMSGTKVYIIDSTTDALAGGDDNKGINISEIFKGLNKGVEKPSITTIATTG